MRCWQTVEGAILSNAERRWLVETAAITAARFASPLILNIGVYKGASMHCLREGAPRAHLVGIDVAQRYVQYLDILDAEFIWKDTRQVDWNREIHLLFVDGGHSYEVVRSDILKFATHVARGGIAAFHDYYRSQEYLEERKRRYPKRAPLGVAKAVNELCTRESGWQEIAVVDSIAAFQRLYDGQSA